MGTSTFYESHKFLRSGNPYSADSTVKAVANPAKCKVKIIGDDESNAIEKREKALRRQYLPEWICDLLEG